MQLLTFEDFCKNYSLQRFHVEHFRAGKLLRILIIVNIPMKAIHSLNVLHLWFVGRNIQMHHFT